METFKILKGDSSRIDLSITPFHDGWCYFTTDDGRLYFDTTVSGKQKRICINTNTVVVANMSEIVPAVLSEIAGQLEPIGKVIFYDGLTAPAGYLACDGTVYNIEDYPKLAAHFAANHGVCNYWGGDGDTTFAVPDWRGEFFRASGTNSRVSQGSGSAVGVHQDGTITPSIAVDNREATPKIAFYTDSASTFLMVRNADRTINTGGGDILFRRANCTSSQTTSAIGNVYTSRPTNTSLLVCIKAE